MASGQPARNGAPPLSPAVCVVAAGPVGHVAQLLGQCQQVGHCRGGCCRHARRQQPPHHPQRVPVVDLPEAVACGGWRDGGARSRSRSGSGTMQAGARCFKALVPHAPGTTHTPGRGSREERSGAPAATSGATCAGMMCVCVCVGGGIMQAAAATLHHATMAAAQRPGQQPGQAEWRGCTPTCRHRVRQRSCTAPTSRRSRAPSSRPQADSRWSRKPGGPPGCQSAGVTGTSSLRPQGGGRGGRVGGARARAGKHCCHSWVRAGGLSPHPPAGQDAVVLHKGCQGFSCHAAGRPAQQQRSSCRHQFHREPQREIPAGGPGRRAAQSWLIKERGVGCAEACTRSGRSLLGHAHGSLAVIVQHMLLYGQQQRCQLRAEQAGAGGMHGGAATAGRHCGCNAARQAVGPGAGRGTLRPPSAPPRRRDTLQRGLNRQCVAASLSCQPCRFGDLGPEPPVCFDHTGRSE